jgi:hypothetical protein
MGEFWDMVEDGIISEDSGEFIGGRGKNHGFRPCVFKTSEVKPCIQHALNGTDHGMGWSDEPPQPALFFVHDQGVYLMTNAKRTDEETLRYDFIAYAKGCHPKKDEDFYEEARDLVGGDDFAETIPVTAETLKMCDLYEEMRIKVNSENMSITFNKPKKS